MYNEIMNRPMFQTPQQRQGAGIMAGVAPVRGYADGDLVSDDFFSIEQTEEGSGMNLRDLTDLFFDPEDPIDYATIGLIAFPPAYIAARLAKMGVKGAKAAEQVQKVVKMQEAIPSKVGGGSSGAKSGLQLQLSTIPAALMGEEEAMAAPSQGKMSREQADATVQEMFRPKGIEEILRQEPPTEMAIGGIVDAGKALFRSLMSKARRGEDVTKEASDAVGRGPEKGGLSPEESDAVMSAQMDLNSGATYMPDAPPEAAAVADDIIEGGGDTILNKIMRNKALTATGASALGLTGYGLLGPDAEPKPPTVPASVELVDDKAPTSKEEVIEEEEEVEIKEPATGFRKFLFGKDGGFGGDEKGEKGAVDFLRGAPADFLQSTMSKLQDPSMQYALAKAAQPSEGFVPRNYLSDLVLAQEEYKDMEAKRDYMQAQTRDVDTTEIEKLTDFFMSTQDVSNATQEEILSLRNDIALSLNSMSKDQALQELTAKMIEVYGNDDAGLNSVRKVVEAVQSGEKLGDVLDKFGLSQTDDT